FIVHLKCPFPQVVPDFRTLYGHYPIYEHSEFADFHVQLKSVTGPRRWLAPQILFDADGEAPFASFPRRELSAVIDWWLNFCSSSGAYQYLMVHAAVCVFNDVAVLFPGSPGSGKSTICAALVYSGWRLLSDEIAMIDRQSGEFVPLCRPISLKNDSIEVISKG